MHKIVLFLTMAFAILASPASAIDGLLPPGEAFKLSARPLDAATVEVRFDIAKGYYLYRKQLRFTSDTAGVTLGEPLIPPGKMKHDENFGRVETYRGTLKIKLPVTGASGITALKVISQGCADAGVCYPPQTQVVAVTLPAK